MKEIIDLIYHEIKASGYENKLMTGIVLTGGGSQIRNLKQLVAFVTGKETRIGYPNEHLGSESKDVVVSPMYSTGVGLVLKGFEYIENERLPRNVEETEEVVAEEVENNNEGIIDKIKDWFTEEDNY